MKQEEVILKIRKLLNLAKTDNEHEASAAMEKVQSLLIQYNLSMRDIDGKHTGRTEAPSGQGKFVHLHLHDSIVNEIIDYNIMQLLQNFFFVRIMIANPSPNRPHIKTRHYYLIGEPHNVEIAQHVFYYLREQFASRWFKYEAEYRAPESHYKQFQVGLCWGLTETLTKQKELRYSGSKALIAIKNELQEYKPANDSGRVVKGPLKPGEVDSFDRSVTGRGVEEGKQIRINQGLNQQATPKKRIA